MRREIPLIITGITGIAFIIAYFIPHRPFNLIQDLFQTWFQIVAAFAIILGVLNLIVVNGNKVYRKSRGWGYSVIIILSFLVMAGIGTFNFGGKASPLEEGTPFMYLFHNVYYPLGSTVFALLAFFVASASFRAFRARNKEAALLLVAAFFVMLGRVPIGDYLTSWIPVNWLRLSTIANWIMAYPNMAAQRAIMIGIALGIISTSLRLILGIEKSYLGGE